MKRLFSVTVLILLLLLVSVNSFNLSVKAEEYNTTKDEYGYNYSCGSKFEVDEITDNGNFEVKGCYLNLSDAKNKMKENDDYVVRYSKGKSPMKIVAMNGGLVYSYPKRVSQSTLYVYEREDESTAGIYTYTDSYREMVYENTQMVNTTDKYGGYGVIKVNLNGFDGYTDLEAVDLIPFKFIDDEIPCYTGADSSSAKKFIIRQNYFVARKNGKYTDLYFNFAISQKHKTANDSIQSGEFVIGSAIEEMEIGKYYYSKDGVTFYKDNHYKNYAFTNYNYFQWLSLRSVADITAAQLKSYLKYIGKESSAFYNETQAFVDAQDKYGMNALIIFGLACNESAYGTDLIKKNNIFGLGAYDSNPQENAYEFDSIADCVNDLEGWHLAKYCDYYYGTSSGFHFYTAPYFGNKGVGVSVKYMSDPYECYKVAGIAYSIDKFINNYDGNYTNNNYYDLAYVETIGANFYSEANNKSTVLYQSYAGSYTKYQKDTIVTVLETGEEYTKVISSNPINSNRKVVKTTGMTEYNHDNSYAYIANCDIVPLNYDVNAVGDYSLSISKFSWNEEGQILISASAQTVNLSEVATCSIILKGKKNYDFELEVNQDESEILVDDVVDISDVEVGNYELYFKTAYQTSKYNRQNQIDNDAIAVKVLNDKLFIFKNVKGQLLLEVISSNQEFETLLVLNELDFKLNDNNKAELSLKGIGVIKGIDSCVDNSTAHYLILKDMNDTSKTYSYKLDYTASYFAINDGHSYDKAGFEGTFELNIPMSSYEVLIKTEIDEIACISNLKTSDINYSNINVVDKENGLNYHLLSNDFKLNQLEIDVLPIYEEIDYSTIEKVENRTSFSNVTRIEFRDNNLEIDAAAMIYYLNYNNSLDVSYKVYLINDTTAELVKMNVSELENKYQYQSNFKSSFNMDYISFSASIDENLLKEGDYRIVIEINKNEGTKVYKDYIELIEPFEIDRGSFESSTSEYSFYSAAVRDRLMLKVEDK